MLASEVDEGGAKPKRSRLWIAWLIVLPVVLFAAASTATVRIDDACYRVMPTAREYHRVWKWGPIPHWACDYPDGSSRNFWPWDVSKHWDGPQ